MMIIERRTTPSQAMNNARQNLEHEIHRRWQRRVEHEALNDSFKRHPCVCQEKEPFDAQRPCDLCSLSLDDREQLEMEGPPDYLWYWAETTEEHDAWQAADPGQTEGDAE